MGESNRLFVLLRHEARAGVHWDLMLEAGELLATWQILDDPAEWAGSSYADPIMANRLSDHRRAYLDYEGPVSGDRGHVVRVDRGACEVLVCESDHWQVRLAGDLLNGVFTLSVAKGSDDACWLFVRRAISGQVRGGEEI